MVNRSNGHHVCEGCVPCDPPESRPVRLTLGRGRRLPDHRTVSLVLGLMLLALGLPGCTTINGQLTDGSETRQGQVVLVRGLMDVFSLGLNDLEADLREEGVAAHTISGPMWRDAGRKISTYYQTEELDGPLVLIGHSYGADDAVRLSRWLESEAIEVELLALIDPTTPPSVPGNVDHCINLYRSSPATDWIPALRGVPVDAESDHTLVSNIDLRTHPVTDGLRSLNHFNIEANDGVRQVILAEVLRVLPERRDRAIATVAAAPEEELSAARVE